MADVRALLKAKRQEARIVHPLASYNQNGQLRCAVCGSLVKHASAWDGHLGSKIHRTNVARLKEEERLREEERALQELEQEQMSRGKRKAEDSGSEDSEEGSDAKKRRVDGQDSAGGVFPVDFFSDPSRAPLPPPSDDSGDEEMAEEVAQPAPLSGQAQSQVDLEYERFQREMLNGPDHRETYERATVFAEAELASETPEGFPMQQVEETTDAPNKLTEEQERRKKEQEERELIMDRLLDEERAQEEADMKVTVMKNRLDALKKKREARSSKVGATS